MREISINEFNINAPVVIGKEWTLITSGSINNFNTMTASWGGIGHLWNKDVAFIFIRPQRYTFKFVEENDYLTLTFFGNSYRKELGLLGRLSGKDVDKVSEANFHPLSVDGTVTFEEAKYTLVCRKLYADDLKGECFIDQKVDESSYPEKDYHRMYVVEIMKVYVQ